MACEKYSAWMTDAALGELAPGREPELLAHAAGCDACREAYQHAQQVAAFVDRGVVSLVSGEPSPHFMPRVRARIAAEPAPSRYGWLVAWAPAAAGALALAAVLLVLLIRSPRPGNPNRVSIAPAENPPATAPATSPPRAAAVVARRDARFSRSPVSHNSPEAQAEVLVQPGQFAAVLQYADALRSGRIDGDQLIAAQQSLDKPLEMTPIEIPLLDAPKNGNDTAESTDDTGRL
jgi:hypothetical protein